MALHKLWVEKYRPHKIDQYIFQNPNHKSSIMTMINEKSIPHLLLSGVRGTGKTTLSRILINSIGVDKMDVLTINASDERGIDTFRDKIKSFAGTVAIGTYKVIQLEEADKLTPDAQTALKSFMEDMSDYVRFILTCNHVNKIIVEIRSRCQEFFFKASHDDDIAEYVVTILAAEKVKFTLDNVYKYVYAGAPDVRKIVNNLQQNTVNGVLQDPLVGESLGADYKFELLDLLAKNKWAEARSLVCANVTGDEWEMLYRFLYDNIIKVPKFEKSVDFWEEAILLINDHLRNHAWVGDKEINAAALFIRLSMIK